MGPNLCGSVDLVHPANDLERQAARLGILIRTALSGRFQRGFVGPVGPTAEAYWNFLIPGVIVIYSLGGLIIFWAHHLFLRFGENPFVAAAYVRFIMEFVMAEEHFVPYFHTLLLLGLLWFLARTFATDQSKVSAPAPISI